MNVGERLSELRLRRGYTTNKLANLCGLSQSFVRSVELGEKGITTENLRLLCDALGVTLQDFFAYTGTEEDQMLLASISALTKEQKHALDAFLKTI